MKSPKARPSTKPDVDFTAVITDMDGKPVIFGDESAGQQLTLARVVTMSLLAETPDERLDAVQTMERWTLAQKIYNATAPISLKAEEVVLLRRVIQVGWGLMVRGRALDLLPE